MATDKAIKAIKTKRSMFWHLCIMRPFDGPRADSGIMGPKVWGSDTLITQAIRAWFCIWKLIQFFSILCNTFILYGVFKLYFYLYIEMSKFSVFSLYFFSIFRRFLTHELKARNEVVLSAFVHRFSACPLCVNFWRRLYIILDKHRYFTLKKNFFAKKGDGWKNINKTWINEEKLLNFF